jgi:hypothetical protein
LGATRRDLGDLDGTRQLLKQALAGYRRVLGEDHPYTLTAMNNLATTRRDLGDLDGARQLHEQVLAGRRRVLGEDHPDTLNSMSNLAAVKRELEQRSGELDTRLADWPVDCQRFRPTSVESDRHGRPCAVWCSWMLAWATIGGHR